LQTDVASTDVIAAESTLRPSQIDAALGRPAAARTPIDPSLPPDHPLEPGSTSRSRAPSPSAERVAPAEAASESKPPVIPDPGTGKPDFIAAAWRAAQAASASSAEGKNAAKSGARQPKKLTERLRTLAVAAAVVVIVVGGFHIISRLFEDALARPRGSTCRRARLRRRRSRRVPRARRRKLSQTRRPARSRRTSRQSRSRRSTPRICWHRSHCPASSLRKSQRSRPRAGLDIFLRASARSPEAAPPGAGAPMDITGRGRNGSWNLTNNQICAVADL
jgi:hypothetical protein